MDFTFTPEQEALKRTIVRFARERLNDDLVARDREQRFSRERWRACGELGLPGLPVPESLGGAGLDPLTTAIALEAFGYGCADNGLVFSVAAHLLSCVVPLWKFGAPEQQARWLPGLCDGTWIGVHAMTEPESGSDSFAMRTRAVKDGDGWRITGTKTFISNGPEADVVIVFALTDPARGFHGGVTGFLVEKGTPGFTASRKIEKMGLRTSPFGALSFDEVWVPDAAVVGQVGGGSAISSTPWTGNASASSPRTWGRWSASSSAGAVRAHPEAVRQGDRQVPGVAHSWPTSRCASSAPASSRIARPRSWRRRVASPSTRP